MRRCGLLVRFTARVGGTEPEHGGGEEERGAYDQRSLEAGGERVRNRGMGGQQVVGAAGGDRCEDGEPECAPNLLGGVQQRGGEPGLVGGDAGIRGCGDAHEHRPNAE